MTESRIQDWIRYVQERAENVPPDEETDTDAPTTATEIVPRGAHNRPRSARLSSVLEQEPPQSAVEEIAPAAAPLRSPSAAVARAGSRIKRVVAASGRKFASPATSDSSASDPVESKTASTISADAELTAAEVETNAVEQCLDIPSAASTREVISRKDGATRLPSALAPAVPNLPIRSATARGVAVHGAKVRQRVRQRPETRTQMLERLTNPTISLYEASVLLDVCSATVRRYTNSGVLPHVRTDGGQRRFRLHDVLVLMRDMEGAKKQ